MVSVHQAFKAIERKNFLPARVAKRWRQDAPLPIGYGQTNSQPSTVRMMLRWLDAQVGNKVLDVGSGSGWTTALLAHMVEDKGRVYAVELVPELVSFGKKNCQQLGIPNVSFHRAGATFGLAKHAPFDRILVSAASNHLPKDLLNQLKIGGKLVVPVKNDILEITKTSKTKHDTINHPGFVFVPLLKD